MRSWSMSNWIVPPLSNWYVCERPGKGCWCSSVLKTGIRETNKGINKRLYIFYAAANAFLHALRVFSS